MKKKRVKVGNCQNCGKARGDHQAKTLACPVGVIHRTLGPLGYSPVHVYHPKERK
jgi:hypothetical protein